MPCSCRAAIILTFQLPGIASDSCGPWPPIAKWKTVSTEWSMFNRSSTAPVRGWRLPENSVALDLFNLSGKTALVTGSSAGLGAAIAVALAEAGADVVCHGNSRPAAETCRKIQQSTGRRSAAIQADL